MEREHALRHQIAHLRGADDPFEIALHVSLLPGSCHEASLPAIGAPRTGADASIPFPSNRRGPRIRGMVFSRDRHEAERQRRHTMREFDRMKRPASARLWSRAWIRAQSLATAERRTAWRPSSSSQGTASLRAPSDQVVPVREDDRRELRVDVQLLEDVLDVVADGHRSDEELLADRAVGRPSPRQRSTPSRGPSDRSARRPSSRSARTVPARPLPSPGCARARRPSLAVPKDVDDGRERGMVSRDGEEGDLDVLARAGPVSTESSNRWTGSFGISRAWYATGQFR